MLYDYNSYSYRTPNIVLPSWLQQKKNYFRSGYGAVVDEDLFEHLFK